MARRASYERVQTNAFSALVKDGTYSESFVHAPPAQEFFQDVMIKELRSQRENRLDGLRVLDCGCGNGAWLDFYLSLEGTAAIESCYGFDLTPEMVSVAEQRLSRKHVPTYLDTGNILQNSSYEFSNGTDRFDLIFTYDVIQQIPRKLQLQACEVMIDHLREQGIAIVFDNDCRSKFGRRMGIRKFATRYLGMSLVPEYYCNAHYPALEKFARNLNSRSGLEVEILVSPAGAKRAMIIRKN